LPIAVPPDAAKHTTPISTATTPLKSGRKERNVVKYEKDIAPAYGFKKNYPDCNAFIKRRRYKKNLKTLTVEL